MSNRIVPLLTRESVAAAAVHAVAPYPTSSSCHSYESFPVENVASLCSDAQAGFNKWKSMPLKERAFIFTAFGRILDARKDELISSMVDVGIAPAFAKFNVFGSISQIEHYTSIVNDLASSEIDNFANEYSLFTDKGIKVINNCQVEYLNNNALVLREPIGPVLSISPWNAPLILSTRALMAPLSAGCSVILKGSNLSPEISYQLTRAFHEAGGEKDLVQCIHTCDNDSKRVVDEILHSGVIKGINFTGSTKTGLEIKKSAAEAPDVKGVWELGGKNCTIFDESITNNSKEELQRAIKETLVSAFFNTGQVCMCTDIVYVPQHLLSLFKTLFTTAVTDMSTEEANALGFNAPLRTMANRHNLSAVLSDAVESHNAEVVYGDITKSGPVILANVGAEAKILREECFAPVLCIQGYRSLSEVSGLVDQVGYGLKLSIRGVYTPQKAVEISRHFRSGSVHCNEMSVFDVPALPHGGMGLSGAGRFNSWWGIREWQYEKLVTF